VRAKVERCGVSRTWVRCTRCRDAVLRQSSWGGRGGVISRSTESTGLKDGFGASALGADSMSGTNLFSEGKSGGKEGGNLELKVLSIKWDAQYYIHVSRGAKNSRGRLKSGSTLGR